MTNNQLAENSVNQLLNSVRLARDNAERADNRVDHSFYFALTIALQELQERRKAAMDSEPVADVVAWSSPNEERKCDIRWRRHDVEPGPLYRHAQPAVDSEFIPKNLDKALGVLGMAIPESREEFNFQTERWIQRLIDRVIRYADEFQEQPAPVAPLPDVVSVLLNHLEDVLPDDAFNLIDVKAWNAVSMLTCPDACRAAMLQDESVTAANKLGNSPAIPDTWIPVSERMPEREVDVQVYCSDKKEQMVGYLERNEQDGYFRYATWRTGDGIYCQPTHWMPLPAAPQEVKGDD